MSNIPKFLGEGSYGCIHYPRILCEDEDPEYIDNKVSKIMKQEKAEEEFKENELMDAIDPKFMYHLPTPIICSPNMNETTQNAINLCQIKTKNIKNYKLLVMENGGFDLTILPKILKQQQNELSKQIMVNFWKEATKIMDGLELFEIRNVVHHDLKGQNIVYDIKTNKINFIDFGMMRTKQDLKEKSKNNNNKFASWHWSFPPEIEFINKKNYLKFQAINKINKNLQQNILQNYFSKSYFLEFKKLDEKTQNELFKKKNKKKLNEVSSLTFNSTKKVGPLLFMDEPLFIFMYELTKNVNEATYTSIYFLLYKQFQKFLNDVNNNNYNYFLDKTLSTIDTYGVGLALLQLYHTTKEYTFNHIHPQFEYDIYELFINMINFNVFDRIHPFHANIQFKNIIAKYFPEVITKPISISIKEKPLTQQLILQSLLNQNISSKLSFSKKKSIMKTKPKILKTQSLTKKRKGSQPPKSLTKKRKFSQ